MLSIEDLGVRYQDGKQALRKINLDLNTGETVGLIGANGAGKSTLLKTIVGIITPEIGNITVDGVSVNKKNLPVIRQKVGMIFQNPEDQLFLSNVYDDIAFGLRNRGLEEVDIKDKVSRILESFDVSSLREKNSSRLSGGEQRLVAIATVMVMEPQIILFDEPTAFLDPKTRRRLMKEIGRIKVTKMIATHDLDMALELCDRIIILKEGSIFQDGDARTLLSDEMLMEKADLELPLCLQR